MDGELHRRASCLFKANLAEGKDTPRKKGPLKPFKHDLVQAIIMFCLLFLISLAQGKTPRKSDVSLPGL